MKTTINLPGFTATSALGKSTINYGVFGAVNYRRASSLVQPQLRISDPEVFLILDGGGGLADPSTVNAVNAKRVCAQCRSRCFHLPPKLIAQCLDACPCD